MRIKKYYSALKSFWQRKVKVGFLLPANALVIDIGSGDKPFWRADVFFDNLQLDNCQRNTNAPAITNMGLFISGDIGKKTRFPKYCFDYCFCAHLLEHVDDPAAVINEIMRIAAAGYLEVPNGTNEALSPFVSHLWAIYLDGDTLVFRRKTKDDHAVWSANYVSFHRHCNSLAKPFISYHWRGSIKYRIIDCPANQRYYPAKVAAPTVLVKPQTLKTYGGAYLLIVRFLRKFFYHCQQQKKRLQKIAQLYA